MEYNVYDILDKIRKRPGMYLYNITLLNLYDTVAGYRMAMDDIGAVDTSNPPFAGFRGWLEKKYYPLPAGLHWMSLIIGLTLKCSPIKANRKNFLVYITKQKHLASVRLFFELLDEYRTQDKIHS